jgi:molybdopterin molybdotransferase
MISFDEAYQLTLDNINPLDVEHVALLEAQGRIVGHDLSAKVDSPSLDVSLKDGYAIHSVDIVAASPTTPRKLSLVGHIAAGENWRGIVHTGEAVRILSGAALPQGADAVVSEEFTQVLEREIQVFNHAEPGRNILRQGTDVKAGRLLVSAGQPLIPTIIGWLAAAGYEQIPVVQRPRVAIVATGDEVLAPGQPLVRGKLYASNLFTLAAWCRRFGYEVETMVSKDDEALIRQALLACLAKFDITFTSGGAWKGEHDLVSQILDSLGWQQIFHRVRMGPGKAVGFGLFQGKPVFCLPGGPPSNHMAFLQLGLPGLQKLAGAPHPGLSQTPALLSESISGQSDWTQFIHGQLAREDKGTVFYPIKIRSRLQELALTQAIARIAEGQDVIDAGSTIMVQVIGD